MSKDNKKFCSKCGNELDHTDNFCNKCGTKILNNKNGKKKNAVADTLIYVVAGIFIFILVMMVVLKKNPAPVTPSGNGAMQNLSLQDQHQSVHTFINELKTKINQDPNDIITMLVLANFLHDEGMVEEAITYYKKYIEKDPKNPDAIVDLGICYFESGDSKAAITEMEKALILDPKHQKAYFNIGIISLKEIEIQKAMEYFEKCYKVNPADPTGIQAKEILDAHKNRN